MHTGRLSALALGLALLCACGKTLTVEEPRELTLRPATSAPTKADPELNGASLGTDNTYVILASASATGIPEFMTGQLYTYFGASGKWQASSASGPGLAGTYTHDPVYWPLSGVEVDFLALALKPEAYDALTIPPGAVTFFDASHGGSAGGVTIKDWDTYDNQYDVLYAYANNRTNSPSTVPLIFQHTMAVIGFTAKSVDATANIFTIKSLVINGLDYAGTLTIDNTNTDISSKWSGVTSGDKSLEVPNGSFSVPPVSATGNAIRCAQNLLVIPQISRPITLTYRVSSSPVDMTLYLPLPRQAWKAGHRYIYNLGFNATEIKAEVTDVSVSAWGDVVDESISIQ